MTPQEYLKQTYQLNQRIDSKLEQISTLRELATKVTSTLSDMPKNKSGSTSSLADTVIKIVDLENEVNRTIDTLVDLKVQVYDSIRELESPEEQFLLELRYLNFKTWEEIAIAMGYGLDNVFKIHKRAMKKIQFSQKQ